VSVRTLEVVTRSEQETIAVAERLAAALEPGDVVALRGDLGAGKTRFVRGLARGLGADPTMVRSPTFVLANEYPTADGRLLIHADAYRLDRSGDDAGDLRLDDLIARNAIAVIEWADRLDGPVVEPTLRVRIHHVDPDTRTIELDGPDRLISAAGA